MRTLQAIAAALLLTALAGLAAADEYHDPGYQAEKGDPSCRPPGAPNVVTIGCGPSPPWLRAAKERASEANLLRLTVSRNAAAKPTGCNVRLGQVAVRYLASGNDAFLFGLWLAQYHPELLEPSECTVPVMAEVGR